MRISDFTSVEFTRYFESRLSGKIRKSGRSTMAQCPFHPDKSPSLSLNLEKGLWKCHAGCGEGGLIDFEKRLAGCDDQGAISRIADAVGLAQRVLGKGGDHETVYPYTDVFGKLLFQVLRYPGKKFLQRKPKDGGGWDWKTADVEMVLYNLPKIATATQILVVEGEKDADNLVKALGEKFEATAVTTSPRGAGKWREEFGVYFAGKSAIVFEDNDEAGRAHAETVCRSVSRYCKRLKKIALPGLPEHGDVSDYLASHSVDEMIAFTKQADIWRPPEVERSLFMSVPQFEQKAAPAIDWMVEGVIQSGSNGLVISRPKSGKSYLVLDLALALASGTRWLDFFVPRRTRVAMVSREDNGSLTQWREMKLRAARGLSAEDLDGWLYVNAKGMCPKVMLDDESEVKTLVEDLKRFKSEFLILDVMRVLHAGDENDNTEMQRIIDVLNRIQDAAGCSICLVHHDNKTKDATLTERARGASAIAGYAEFMVGIRVVDEQHWIREFKCELKASVAPDPFYWSIIDMPDKAGIGLGRVEWYPPDTRRRNGSKATEFEPTEFES